MFLLYMLLICRNPEMSDFVIPFNIRIDPPVVSVQSRNVTVNETGEFSLDCEYDANPPLLTSVKWYSIIYSFVCADRRAY